MRKILRIFIITAGIISAVSAVVLGCVYMEDILKYVNTKKNKMASRLN